MPAAAEIAPAAVPAAAPQTPAPAAQPDLTPPPTPAASPPGRKSWTQALDDLESLPEPAPKEPAKVEKTAAKSEPEPAKSEEPPAKSEAPPKPAEKAPAEPDDLPKFQTNADLRKWAKQQFATARETQSKLAEAEKKLAELSNVVPKTQAGAENLAQRIAEQEKRIAQYEQVLEVQAFEHSTKYQTEYAAPYQQALARAEKEITELMVNEPTGEKDENDQPIMRQRPATKQDFHYIYSLPRSQARAMAKQMFGDEADEVIDHRKRVNELAEKAITALQDRKQNFQKYRQEEMQNYSQQQVAIQKLWHEANTAISNDPKRALYWGEEKDDPEANKALAAGFQLADEFFSEKRDQMNPQERVEFDAYIRHSIAMGPKLAYKLKRALSENEQLRAEIGQLRGSEPGAPNPISGEPAPTPKGVMGALDDLTD